MNRNVRGFGLLVVMLLSLAFGAFPVAAARPAAVVNGSGVVMLTYTASDLPTGPYPATYRIVGVVASDGSAKGHVYFLFEGAGAAQWDAVPDADAEKIVLKGSVSEGIVGSDGTVTLQGQLIETDYVAGGGIGFQSNDPFAITVGGDLAEDAFVLQWCAISAFNAEIIRGNLHVHIPHDRTTASAAAMHEQSVRSCNA